VGAESAFDGILHVGSTWSSKGSAVVYPLDSDAITLLGW